MEWKPPEVMQEYLMPTHQCDSENEEIKRKTLELITGSKTPKEAAISIFFYVRDQIVFARDTYDIKASDTLRKGIGSCTTKTNIQVALLRAAQIPARYHQAVLSKDCVKDLIPAFVYKISPDQIWWHPWCECFLSGKWIACDSLLDQALYTATIKKGIFSKEQIPTIDWDGENNLNTMSDWILEDVGTFHSFDDIFQKVQKDLPPKIIISILLSITNRYTDKVRKL